VQLRLKLKILEGRVETIIFSTGVDRRFTITPSRPSPEITPPQWALRILPADYETIQPSHRTHHSGHQTTPGSGKWRIGTTSEGTATMQSRARRVLDGATICRWYEDEPRTPMATLGRGSTALPTTTAPLAPLAGWFLRFHAASLLPPLRWHAECRRRCGSFASSDYFHETVSPPMRALSLRYCTSAANQVSGLGSWFSGT
jgi:hypothetical protein